jgi:hypothetical protein
MQSVSIGLRRRAFAACLPQNLTFDLVSKAWDYHASHWPIDLRAASVQRTIANRAQIALK